MHYAFGTHGREKQNRGPIIIYIFCAMSINCSSNFKSLVFNLMVDVI